MNLYLVPRTSAWRSEEEIAATVDCAPAVIETLGPDVRWIRSYIVREEDGTFSGYCLYEATGPQVLRDLAEAMKLPADAIKPVAAVVAAPDPA